MAGNFSRLAVWVKFEPETFRGKRSVIHLVRESEQRRFPELLPGRIGFRNTAMDGNGIFYGDSPIVQVWTLLAPPVVLAIYFRFGRIWSLRNLDLALLLTISLGVVLGPKTGHNRITLLCVLTGVLLLRLLLDSFLQRRPRIDTNVNGPGLAVLGLTGLGLIVATTFDGLAQGADEASTRTTAAVAADANSPSASSDESAKTPSPTTVLLKRPAVKIAREVTRQVQPAKAEAADEDSSDPNTAAQQIATGSLVVFGHLMVIVGLITLGVKTFQDPKAGVAMAALYCLLPCTVIVPRAIQYILPSGLILWAFVAHRRPVVSGILLGLACGAHMFPFVLIPIWLVYYGRETGLRFAAAWIVVLAALFGGFAFVSSDVKSFLATSLGSIEVGGFWILGGELTWSSRQFDLTALIATAVGLAALLIGLAVWPRRKTFADLLAHSVAIVVAVFLWYSFQTDWFLPGVIPFVIAVAYRPKMLERVRRYRETEPPAATETPRSVAPRESMPIGIGGPE